jgi:hypothetical protein
MDVAVVIPLYNGARWIPQTLDSVFAQHQRPAEVWVIDDGSTDGSVEIVRQIPGINVLSHSGKGENQVRQFGLQHVSAPLVAFLDHDDLWSPNHLQVASRLLEEHSECPAAVAQIQGFTGEDRQFLLPRPSPPHSWAHPHWLDPWATFPFNRISTCSGVVIRRECLLAVGGWPTHLFSVGDYYLWLRLAVHGPLLNSHEATVGYRLHPQSTSATWRTTNLARYLADMRAAAVEALGHRLAVRPEGETVLAPRLAILDALADVVKCVIAADARFAAAAVGFAAAIAGGTHAFMRRAYGALAWFLQPLLSNSDLAHRQALLEVMNHDWPDEARKTREVILACLPAAPD